METVYEVAREFWYVLAEMAPYLLFGFLVAGLLSVFVSPRLVERHLGRRGFGSVIKAAIFGIPLPLCSCGVIPVGASLRRSGASRGATSSFLISTPQTGVDSILVTYSLLGPVFAVVRPVAALLTGLVGGMITSAGEDDYGATKAAASADEACDDACAIPDGSAKGRSLGQRVVDAFRYGFVALPQDIGRSLIIGLVVAGLIGAFVPGDFFTGLPVPEWATMLIMLAAGIPVYVCATGSVPIAAALMLKGLSPGAAIVFLMTGPATNAATLAIIWNVLGRRSTVVYLATVALGALATGAVLNAILGVDGGGYAVEGTHHMMPAWLQTGSAVLLLAVLAGALWQRRFGHGVAHSVPTTPGRTSAGKDDAENTMSEQERVSLSVKGMNCNHCVNAVQRALASVSGVQSVDVDLGSGSAVVRGVDLDAGVLKRSVEEVGYSADVS